MEKWEVVLIQGGVQTAVLPLGRWEQQPTGPQIETFIRNTANVAPKKLGGLDVAREYEYVIQKA